MKKKNLINWLVAKQLSTEKGKERDHEEEKNEHVEDLQRGLTNVAEGKSHLHSQE